MVPQYVPPYGILIQNGEGNLHVYSATGANMVTNWRQHEAGKKHIMAHGTYKPVSQSWELWEKWPTEQMELGNSLCYS